ncbi:MAG: DKNYY domain-containing protein [Chitinophagaceae bacterium]
MRSLLVAIIIFFIELSSSCNDHKIKTSPQAQEIYAREPVDSGSYKYIKYKLYYTSSGQLCERKLVFAKGTDCNCLFKVYYDSIYIVYTRDTILEKPLNAFIDINSFVEIDSTQFSKDKNRVFYFHSNSDGGNRAIVHKADPATFKRLCEYRWGIDKDHVFYETDILEGLNVKNVQVLYPPDTSDHFIEYIKDEKNVFKADKLLTGADAKTFKVVSGEKWLAEDKNKKYY